jgi:hypothetical protein
MAADTTSVVAAFCIYGAELLMRRFFAEGKPCPEDV